MDRKKRKKKYKIISFDSESSELNPNKQEFKINKYNRKINLFLLVIIIISIIFNIIIFNNYKIQKQKFNWLLIYLNNINSTLAQQIITKLNNKNEIDTNISTNISRPFLPLNKDDIPIKKYSKTSYNTSNARYHLDDIYKNRTLFKIDYNYIPYTKIDKSLSYDENAHNIYESTGMLNITLLDFYYNGIDIDKTKFNHIHLNMGFDANYVLLSSISIASILNNSSPDTFIHLHLVLNDCTYENIKPIIDLKKINKNIEFILYNGKQAEYDFGERSKKEWRGIGDYARVLVAEIVNNTNKIITLDSGDIVVNKDLSELYFYDMGDNYFVFTLDEYAGTTKDDIHFAKNNFYPNTGVCMINVRKFREDNLYKAAYFTSLAYSKLICPYQDISIMISNYKFKFWGINYNCPEFLHTDRELNGTDNAIMIDSWFNNQISPFKYSKEELKQAALDPVITHLYHTKPFRNEANHVIQERWRKYANMTGLYEQIKHKYPEGFPNITSAKIIN